MKSLVADKSVVSLLGVEREEDATSTALFLSILKIWTKKNLAERCWSFDSGRKEKNR